MRISDLDPHAAFIFSDDEALASNHEPPDPLRKFFEPQTSANVEDKFLKVHQADSPMFATSRPVAKSAAAPASEWDMPVGAMLEKRFAQGLELSAYRDWYRAGIALGKSADGMLADWIREHPSAG